MNRSRRYYGTSLLFLLTWSETFGRAVGNRQRNYGSTVTPTAAPKAKGPPLPPLLAAAPSMNPVGAVMATLLPTIQTDTPSPTASSSSFSSLGTLQGRKSTLYPTRTPVYRLPTTSTPTLSQTSSSSSSFTTSSTVLSAVPTFASTSSSSSGYSNQNLITVGNRDPKSSTTSAPSIAPMFRRSVPVPFAPSGSSLDASTKLELPNMLVTIPSTTNTTGMETNVNDFLTAFLAQNAKTAFYGLHTLMNLTHNASTVILSVTGTADYAFGTLTQQDLNQILTTYFHFWGARDLQNYLNEHAHTNANAATTTNVTNLQVWIDGAWVQASNEQASPTNPSSAASAQQPPQAPAVSPTVGLLVGLILAFVFTLLALALVLLIVGYRRRMSAAVEAKKNASMDSGEHTEEMIMDKQGSSEESPTAKKNQHPSSSHRKLFPSLPLRCCRSSKDPSAVMMDTLPAAATTQTTTDNLATTPTNHGMMYPDDIISLSGMVSVEESLFTTTDASYFSRLPPFQYDASRLDQVISDAKVYDDVMADVTQDDDEVVVVGIQNADTTEESTVHHHIPVDYSVDDDSLRLTNTSSWQA